MAASLGALLEDRALESTPSEEDLNEVSKEAGDGWKNLLRHMGVPEEKVDSLLEKHGSGNPVSACFEGLVFWREGNEPCRPATWSVLLEALEKGAEKREYARELREKIVSRLTLITQQLEPAITPSSQRQLQPTPPMPTMDKVIGDIVEMYRKGQVSVPHNPKLEDSYDNIMVTFYAILSTADSDLEAITRLQRVLQERYDGKDNQGARQIPLPKVPETANGLFKFIFARSTPYEILLMHPAVEAVGHQELKRELREYESKMIKFLQKSSMSCRKRQVPLPLYKDHTHMAVVIPKEQVLLSLVLEMKEYFSKNLQLEETLFEGFEDGCTLFFSILRADADLLSPKVLSHLSELRMFGMTHLIVFGYFACDLEKATVDSEIFNIPATCQDELRPRISSYVQAARDLVQHRDTGMSWFREAADDLDVAFKRAAAAKIAGRILTIIGVVLCIVSVGLLIGGVTSPAGAVLVLVGYPLVLIGKLVTAGAALGDVVKKRVLLKRANRWIRQGSDLSRDLIEKHESYHEELDRIVNLCYKSEEEIMVIVLKHNEGNEESDLNLDVTGFHSADSICASIVADWKNALEIGAEDAATAFVTGAVIKSVITGYDVAGSNLSRTINKLSTSHPSAASLGLSSVLLVVDIALIAKTAHNMKIKKGTDLANKLRQAADDMEEETAQLRPLANFANELDL